MILNIYRKNALLLPLRRNGSEFSLRFNKLNRSEINLSLYNRNQSKTLFSTIPCTNKNTKFFIQKCNFATDSASSSSTPPSSSIQNIPIKRDPSIYSDANRIMSKVRRKNWFFRPLKLDEDLPLLIDKEDGKTKPKIFLPRANHNWWKLWGVPEVVAIPRKQLISMQFAYVLIGTLIFVAINLPKGLLLLKDAEKKHLALSKEVELEEKYLMYVQNLLTPEELFTVFDSLPHKPGEEWNPIIEAEEERLRHRVIYPD